MGNLRTRRERLTLKESGAPRDTSNHSFVLSVTNLGCMYCESCGDNDDVMCWSVLILVLFYFVFQSEFYEHSLLSPLNFSEEPPKCTKYNQLFGFFDL